MLASFGRHVRIRALIAFAVLLIANRIIFKLNIFGSELVDNYFFSQLFAQAGMLCVLAIALLLERCEIRRGYRYAFLIVAILVIEGAHLLPALELLVCMGVLVLSDLVDRWIGKRTASHAGFYTYLLLSGSVLLGTAAAVLVHPTFGAMRMISENNGDLTVNRFGSIMSLVLLAVLNTSARSALQQASCFCFSASRCVSGKAQSTLARSTPLHWSLFCWFKSFCISSHAAQYRFTQLIP
jgi:hypothetical protein